MERKKLTTLLLSFQAVLIVLFAILVRYDENIDTETAGQNETTDATSSKPNNSTKILPMFQNVHVMLFFGLGFLMSFMRRYGYGGVGFTMTIAALCLQWATLVEGVFHLQDGTMKVNVETMANADFAAAVVLISAGTVWGRLSYIQMVTMAAVEVVFYSVNDHINSDIFKVADFGGSMSIHVFAACFGLAVSRFTYTEDVEKALFKAEPVYHSDLFCMVGTLFVWAFWPSFTSIFADETMQPRVAVNTYFSLAASAVTALAMSSLLSKTDKLSMVHIENCTLSGGVVVGTCVNMMIYPSGALALGTCAAAISAISCTHLTPIMARWKLYDQCGITYLHGMPGILGGVAGILATALATEQQYGYGFYKVFPARAPEWGSPELALLQGNLSTISAGEGRTALQQAAWQAVGVAFTIGFALCSGIVTGFLLRLPTLEPLEVFELFDDSHYWEMPDEGVPQFDESTEMDNLIK